jgi:hypothetical protein
MRELKFNVFGRLMAVAATDQGWALFLIGPEGKRRRAEVEIPDFVQESELSQYLADVFHEAATPANGDVIEIR